MPGRKRVTRSGRDPPTGSLRRYLCPTAQGGEVRDIENPNCPPVPVAIVAGGKAQEVRTDKPSPTGVQNNTEPLYISPSRDQHQPTSSTVPEGLGESTTPSTSRYPRKLGNSQPSINTISTRSTSPDHIHTNLPPMALSPAPTIEMPLSKDLKDILASLTTKQDLKAILTSMVTKQDMDAQTERLEASLRREINDIHAETTATSGRVDQLEQTTATIQQQVINLETSHATMLSQLHSHNMLIDDLENRSRRNNVKIRGLPESIANTELKSTVLQLFSSILGSSEGSGVELDRVHRSLGAQQQDRPRDVLCRIHYFTTKEQIIQKAWEKRPLNFNGHEILILPDLSRRTLFMRNQLKPLLQLISSAEGTYKWGHPFHLLIRKGGRSFRLLTPTQLPDVFTFLQVDPIEIPDWTILAPSSSVPRPPRRRSRSGRRRIRE